MKQPTTRVIEHFQLGRAEYTVRFGRLTSSAKTVGPGAGEYRTSMLATEHATAFTRSLNAADIQAPALEA